MKALVGVFNQEKALVGAFCVIVKTDCETDGALHSTTDNITLSITLGVYRNVELDTRLHQHIYTT